MPHMTSIKQIGIEKGRDEERRSLALKMLQENIALATIARITAFTIIQLQQLPAETPAKILRTQRQQLIAVRLTLATARSISSLR